MAKAPEYCPRSPRRYGERPVRLYDSARKACVPHRCFKYPDRALNTTAALLNWLPAPRVIEVYNAQSGRLLGSFRKHVSGDVSIFIDSHIRGKA